MTDFSPPKDVRAWLFRVINLLKMPAVQTIWSRSPGHIYAWAADRRSNGEIRESPLEKIEETLELLNASGQTGKSLAQWLPKHLCGIVGLAAEPAVLQKPEQKDIRDHMLDDQRAMFLLQEAMRKWDHPSAVRHFAEMLLGEINESLGVYLDEYERSHKLESYYQQKWG